MIKVKLSHNRKIVQIVEMRPVVIHSASIYEFISLLNGRKYRADTRNCRLAFEEFKSILCNNKAYFGLPFDGYSITTNGYGQVKSIYNHYQEFDLDEIFAKLKTWLEDHDVSE